MENREGRRNRRQTETRALGLQSLDSGAPGLESYPLGFFLSGISLRVGVATIGAVFELVVAGSAVEAELLLAAAFLLLGRERSARTLTRRIDLHGGRVGRTRPA